MFQGFTPAAQEFLWNIRFNNERAWFTEHKETYTNQLAKPLRDFGEIMLEEMKKRSPNQPYQLHMTRIYRDARRLFGRGPYKENLWFTIHLPYDDQDRHLPLPAFYFGLSPDDYDFGMGTYDATPLSMAKFRARIDRDPAPLEKLVKEFNKQSLFTLEGELYKKPKGQCSELLSPWYNRKNIALCHNSPWDDLVMSSDLVAHVSQAFTFLLPYYEYLCSVAADPDPRQGL